MHITNNAALLPSAKADSSGSSHEAVRIRKNKFSSFKYEQVESCLIDRMKGVNVKRLFMYQCN